MLIGDIIKSFSASELSLEEAVAKVLSEVDEMPVYDPNRPRHPFKPKALGKEGYLGPGQANFVHVPSEEPWVCHRIGPYQHKCTKLMANGKIRKKTLLFDPDKVKQRNLRYRAWARDQRAQRKQGIARVRPGHALQALQQFPRVMFHSNAKLGGTQPVFQPDTQLAA